MSLTTTDINLIKEALAPQFEAIDQRFNELESNFDTKIETEIGNLAMAAQQQFMAIHDQFAQVHSELAVIKDAVVDHGYRLANLEA
ncbi:hypothetical protein IPG36_08250 [bacterium]|nr:MAG: hypothetical protein IPG36_08250 [bacterium]